jgi:hypothetical protein
VLVGELRSTVADDEITIGSVADRCLLSGAIQTSHFKGATTVFDPKRVLQAASDELQRCTSMVLSVRGPLGSDIFRLPR